MIALLLIALIVWWYQKLLRETHARQELQAHYKLLLDSLPSQVMVVNHKGFIETANKQVLEDYNIQSGILSGNLSLNSLMYLVIFHSLAT